MPSDACGANPAAVKQVLLIGPDIIPVDSPQDGPIA